MGCVDQSWIISQLFLHSAALDLPLITMNWPSRQSALAYAEIAVTEERLQRIQPGNLKAEQPPSRTLPHLHELLDKWRKTVFLSVLCC